MKFRFSIRTLLVLTALIAAACYWWIARPTIVARKFARFIAAGDYAAAGAMIISNCPAGISPPENTKLVARLLPRTSDDFRQRQHRIEMSKVGDGEAVTLEQFIATSAGVTTEFGVCLNVPVTFDQSLLPATSNTR